MIPARGDDQAPSWVFDTYGSHAHRVLLDLAEFTDMAARLVERGRSAYQRDEALRLAAEAITHRIGEAVSRLPDDFLRDHAAIEWRRIKGMRNIVAHEYARVDYDIMWAALAEKMPKVAAYIREILSR